jgi:hypothetical protein
MNLNLFLEQKKLLDSAVRAYMHTFLVASAIITY